MRNNTKQIIERIGETDQLFLENNHPELALERADLRLQLVSISHHRQEQIHFLQEAVVLLEQARVEFEEMPMRIYLNLSIKLAQAYLTYFDITQEQRFALITQQILKPLSFHEHAEIYLLLAQANFHKNEPALVRHWLSKYVKHADFDLSALQRHVSYAEIKQQDWLQVLLKSKMN